MSSLTMPAAVTPNLPAVNLPAHGHGHGHKKASPLDATTDSSSNTAAPIPVGTAQNLFGSLFSSLQQIIGGQPAAAVTNPAALTTSAAASSAAAGSAAAAGAKINVMA
jgi:hypothetical protein